MASSIKRRAEVWTADEQKLGLAQYLYHRTEDINPALQLYASYLEVEDFAYGATFYVPTDFLAEDETAPGRLVLSKTRAEAMQRTWFRMPEFVVRGQSRKEALPD